MELSHFWISESSGGSKEPLWSFSKDQQAFAALRQGVKDQAEGRVHKAALPYINISTSFLHEVQESKGDYAPLILFLSAMLCSPARSTAVWHPAANGGGQGLRPLKFYCLWQSV